MHYISKKKYSKICKYVIKNQIKYSQINFCNINKAHSLSKGFTEFLDFTRTL